MSNIIIKPEKTAISTGVSSSAKIICNRHANKSSIKLLDYGCGKLRNTKYLLENNFNVSIIDTVEQISKQKDTIEKLSVSNIYNIENLPNKQFDIILCSFVLNVIPDLNNRNQVLTNISNLISNDGVIYIEVRDNKFVKTLKNNITYNDGILTGSGEIKTFQKPYTKEEFKSYLEEFPFEIVEIKKESNSIIAILKKVEV